MSPRTRATHAALIGATHRHGPGPSGETTGTNLINEFANARPNVAGSDRPATYQTTAGTGTGVQATSHPASSIPLTALPSSHQQQQQPPQQTAQQPTQHAVHVHFSNPLMAQPPPLTVSQAPIPLVTLQPPPPVLVPPSNVGSGEWSVGNALSVPRQNPLLAPLTPRSAEQQAALVAAAGGTGTGGASGPQ